MVYIQITVQNGGLRSYSKAGLPLSQVNNPTTTKEKSEQLPGELSLPRGVMALYQL
jgi:3-mercaptopyruvate sulfurtransferase SseA